MAVIDWSTYSVVIKNIICNRFSVLVYNSQSETFKLFQHLCFRLKQKWAPGVKSPLQKQILREWRQPKWATDMINVGDPSIPPGIKDSLRRAQERRMGGRPPAETAGNAALTSA